MGPGWEVNVSRSALGIRGIARPRWQQDVSLLQLRIATGRLRKIEAFVACAIVAACAVPTRGTLPGMVASSVKNLVAKRAPLVLWALQHAQVVTQLSDELCCWDSETKDYAGGNLPELLGARLAFGEQCGLIHYASLLHALVVSDFVKVVGKLFLAAAGDILRSELLVRWEFGVVGSKVHAKVRGAVVGVKGESLQKFVALVS